MKLKTINENKSFIKHEHHQLQMFDLSRSPEVANIENVFTSKSMGKF